VNDDASPGRVGDNANQRKARGAFFTPAELCRFVARWAVRGAADRVLEPSCGEAAFLLEVGQRLRDLGARPSVSGLLHGVEVHSPSAAHATRLLQVEGFAAEVAVADFFDHPITAAYDAVVGNPPYVRYQDFTGAARLKSAQAVLAQGVRLTGLASSWAAFTVHATQFLKPDGRLGLVLPAELLTVNYAAEVRAYLLRRFAKVRVVLFEERVFPGVTEEVVLLLAEGLGPTDHFELFQVRDMAQLEDSESGSWAWTAGKGEGRWLVALLADDVTAVYREVTEATDSFSPLAAWGDPTLGMVTGNNRYFAISAQQVQDLGLREDEVLRISPPGSRHLRGLTFSQQAWRSMADSGSPTYLFRPDADPSLHSKGARSYLAKGKREGVPAAYKCRIRTHWWRVPLVAVPDLFFTYMNHDAPRLVANQARVGHLNSIHGLRIRGESRKLGLELLPIGMLNSATLLGAELVGRSYGGGILKVEPKEADGLPVPSPALLSAAGEDLRATKKRAASLLSQGRLADVVAIVDKVLLRHHLGLSEEQLAGLRQAREALFVRRSGRR
jgi:adenine-specific DNA-methyltransferase